MSAPADPAPLLADEAIALARYVLPGARARIDADRTLSSRIVDDYARALRQHDRQPLAVIVGGGHPLGPASLWAWDGAAAPQPTAGYVRQQLLLMSAILESQPELAGYFLPSDVSRAVVFWRLFAVAVGTVISTTLSILLRVTSGPSRAA